MECVIVPIFSTYTVECYIDYSAIKRYANTWITTRTQANSTKYLISDCPWIIVYLTHQNLIYFILIYSISLIEVVSCVHNANIILAWYLDHQGEWSVLIVISVIVIMAGIVLVFLLYLLNLMVTNGTISGIIFYANIVSINDSVILVNDNVFKPLKEFIFL